uniref:Fusion glycoprotein F0 n=1 Tax=Chodsigoa hypsibia henipavirus TaxID=3028504 RepID=A0AAT9TT75_9MONO|nr:MAG: fusion protein [Chodsigoa hypsibia henipavirus]
MNYTIVGIMIITFVHESQCINYEQLASIGVIKGHTYNYKIRGPPNTKLMVVKLIPNINIDNLGGGLSNCSSKQMESHKELVEKVLSPVAQALETMRNRVTDYSGNYRFVGAVMAGAALGVATAATVTAGIALHQSNQNAKAIDQMKEAIRTTNKAVQELTLSTRQTLLVIDSLQNQINTQIVPAMNRLSCEVLGLTVGIQLTQYYSEILTYFGPALQDPIDSTLTIQAISHAFGGNFDILMKTMGYTVGDLYDVLKGDLITGKIISVNPKEGFIALEVRFPTLTQVNNAIVQELMPISFNDKGDEWISTVPRYVLERVLYLSNIDISLCSVGETSVVCDNDYASPMSHQLRECLQTNTSYCPRERVLASYVPKFALSQGVIFANCIATTCRCADDGRAISQSSSQTVLLLTSKDCKVYEVQSMMISTGEYLGESIFENTDIPLGPSIVIDKIDISGQLAEINKTLDHVDNTIKDSNDILDKIDVSTVSAISMVILYVVIALIGFMSALSLLLSVRTFSRCTTLGSQFAYQRQDPTLGDVHYAFTSNIPKNQRSKNSNNLSNDLGSTNGSFSSNE